MLCTTTLQLRTAGGMHRRRSMSTGGGCSTPIASWSTSTMPRAATSPSRSTSLPTGPRFVATPSAPSLLPALRPLPCKLALPGTLATFPCLLGYLEDLASASD